MMEIFYRVTGPKEFNEDVPSRMWMQFGTWMSKTIVMYHELQDPKEPGKLFRIVWKPPEAPTDVTRLRLPENWVTEIPNFKYVPKDLKDQWEMKKDGYGRVYVVRK